MNGYPDIRCFFHITIGAKTTTRCRKNKNKQEAIAFESALLANRLGLPWQVEIIEEGQNE